MLVLVFLKSSFIARLCSKCPTPEGSDFCFLLFFHGGQSWMPCNFFSLKESKCPTPEGSDFFFFWWGRGGCHSTQTDTGANMLKSTLNSFFLKSTLNSAFV